MAKGIGVILVLLGHLQGERFFSFSPYILPMCEWIFSFHMPLFFIVAGTLIRHKKECDKDIKEIAMKRFKGIMIPYYWFSFFYLCVVIYALINKSVLPQTLYVNIWYIFSLYGMNVLWFLPTLFIAELVFIYITQKFKVNKSVIITVIMGLIGFLVSYYMTQITYGSAVLERTHELLQVIIRPIIASTFISIGYYGYSLLEGKSTKKWISVGLGLLLIIVGACFVKINHGVDFRSLVFKNVIFYYLCALTGSYGVILLCKGIHTIKPIVFWGSNSLIFMATHNSETVLFWGLKLSMYVNQFITHARGYICYAVVVAVILLYVSIMIFIINRLCPFILGKSFKMNK